MGRPMNTAWVAEAGLNTRSVSAATMLCTAASWHASQSSGGQIAVHAGHTTLEQRSGDVAHPICRMPVATQLLGDGASRRGRLIFDIFVAT